MVHRPGSNGIPTNRTTSTTSESGASSAGNSSELPRGRRDEARTREGGVSGFVRDNRAAILGALAIPGVASVAHATEVVPPQPAEPAPPVNLSEIPNETFNIAKLTEYPLFKVFWNSTNMADGTAHEGLDEVTADGVSTMLNYAKSHNLDGTPSADGAKVVTEAERSLIKAILEHPQYGTFFELDALPKLFSGFGIEASTVHTVAEAAHDTKVALAKAMGVAEGDIHLAFPKAGPNAETTYFSMDGAMATPMSFVDKYREALGLPAGAEAYEKAPVLGWMMGVPEGHTKYGSFSESSPFSTSGLNWGTLLFKGDAEVASLPVKKGFEFPIDALTGFNRAVGGFVSQGDKIVVVDKDGNELKATKVIEKDASGKAISWSAKFTNADGQEVAPSDVTGLIQDRFGNTKGDGKTSGSMNMGWWGFCDRNTALKLYKSKYEIPNIDRDVKIEVNGKTIVIPKADAQKLLDVDVGDMVGRTSFVGARFDDEPMKVTLTNGKTITGKVDGMVLRMGPNATRGWSDNVTIKNSDLHPLLGSLRLQTSYSTSNIDLAEVESITKLPDGNVEVKTHGSSWTQKGKLLTEISFEGAANVDGKLVLTPTKDKPVIGEVTIDLGGGQTKTVKASEVKSIAGEMQNEMKITEYLEFIMRHKGMYATDNSTGVIVSNGMRWINKIDVKPFEGEGVPEFAKGKTAHGVEGPFARVEGDKILLVDGLYKTEWGDGLHSAFSGWIQLDSTGKVINQGFTNGEPDFGWAADGKLDWNAKSSFNPHMTPELRLKMFVNGISDVSKLESMAERLNFPSNWKTLRTADAPQ